MFSAFHFGCDNFHSGFNARMKPETTRSHRKLKVERKIRTNQKLKSLESIRLIKNDHWLELYTNTIKINKYSRLKLYQTVSPFVVVFDYIVAFRVFEN